MRPARARGIVDYLQGAFGASIRKACSCIGLQKSSYFYKPRRPSQAALKQRIKEISETRVRYGYRRIHVLLQREGWEVNVKRVYRLYTELGLQIRNKRPKRKVSAKLREDRRPPEGPNDVWAMDFLSDQLFDGRKIRVLTIVDAFSKIAPAVDVRQRYTGADVVATLERVTADHGLPNSIRVDNGPEFVSKDLDLWAYMNGVILDFSRPGKPTDNSFVEAFNGKVRAECIESELVLVAGRCQAQMRGVQNTTTITSVHLLDRPQDPDRVHEIHRPTQPADRIIARESPQQAVQRSGQAQTAGTVTLTADHLDGAGHLCPNLGHCHKDHASNGSISGWRVNRTTSRNLEQFHLTPVHSQRL